MCNLRFQFFNGHLSFREKPFAFSLVFLNLSLPFFLGTPVNRVPIMAKQTLDLFKLFRLVVDKGGLVEVMHKMSLRPFNEKSS